VLAAIRASGGTESVSETTRVLAVSSAGTAGATILGIVAAIVLSSAPRVWWLGFAPIVLVFVTYRSFISQARDKDRIEALFDASNALHENSELEKIIVTAAEQALQLVKAATAAVIVLPMGNASSGLVTVVDLSGHRRESPTFAALTDRPSFMDPPENRVLTKQTELNDIGYLLGNRIEVHDAVIGVLTLEGNPVGVLVGVNRLGDVSAFTTDDARVLATLARQLSTALENGRLMHNLTEVSTLKEQLEKTLESKSRLVASVSHELRTPLTGVIGLASVVRDGMSDDFDTDARAMLDMIVEQGNELSNIIDDLLAHAKSEAGTLKLSPMAFDLGDEATTVATTQHLDELHRTGSVVVIADPLRVRQILRNLVTNARRYGGPAIRLEIGSRNGFGLAAVIDDGAGVPDEFEAAIFEPYRSAHSPMSQPGSVGLGLALSRTMARMMGGELTYSHRFGETRFELTLPLSTVTHSRG
jgi:signal transduction histidine kinase